MNEHSSVLKSGSRQNYPHICILHEQVFSISPSPRVKSSGKMLLGKEL